MGTRLVRLTDRAYARLDRRRRGSESFTDVVSRLTAGEALMELVGCLDDTEGDALEAALDSARADRRLRTRDRLERQRDLE